ncbi:unnamed protein product [Parascedosporium putredinis]|uniref:Uncharacterized protein n=1 Tax=Parascedosporium putredinis TaxID=1442378 RepID=A0A9P1H4H1_9PEZI|nr:unnamed protein product [Parascedosporium putredinis]CAI7996762.1 unnamed protein product [Parascedosporium putredinis]
MQNRQRSAAALFLLPALAAAAQFSNSTIQGCLDLDCPRTSPGKDEVKSDSQAWCAMSVGVADAAFAEDVISVPGSQRKLSLGLTRTQGVGVLDSLHLSYNYEFWLVQPEGFNLTTGEEDGGDSENDSGSSGNNNNNSTDGNPDVCGNGAANSTDCVGTVLTETCMKDIDDFLQDVDVGSDTAANSTRCEAIAQQLEVKLHRSSCGIQVHTPLITVTGVSLLGKDAPQESDQSATRADDDNFCFANQARAGTFISLDTLTVVTPIDTSDEETPKIPPREVGGYLPLITLPLDDEGRASAEASFICMKTLDQIYWTESAGVRSVVQTMRVVAVAAVVSAGLIFM